MRKILICMALAIVLALGAFAERPTLLRSMSAPTDAGAPAGKAETGAPSSAADAAPSPQGEGYSDAEINEITNVVNGEVGGITGTVVLTYADGSQLWTDGSTLRRIHARIVDNQVRSGLFPDSVDGCVRQCWSPDYASTGWRDSAQWLSCREYVLDALGYPSSAAAAAPSPPGEGLGTGDPSATEERAGCPRYGIPDNVFAATCDPAFCQWYPGWYLWARVDWDTGWYSGVFYYYAYGG